MTREGIRIQHSDKRSCLTAIPVPGRPTPVSRQERCPTCNVTHTCQHVHLWLDDQGTCIVSKGVLNTLILSGGGILPSFLRVMNVVSAPPPLTLRGAPPSQVLRASRNTSVRDQLTSSRIKTRPCLDADNRSIRVFTKQEAYVT